MTLRSHTWPALVALLISVGCAFLYWSYAPTSHWIEYRSVEYAKLQTKSTALEFVSTARVNRAWTYQWEDELWCPSLDNGRPYSRQPWIAWRPERDWQSSKWAYSAPFPKNTECYLKPILRFSILGLFYRVVDIPPTDTFITPPDNG